ncbi:copper resistance protein B [Rhizobacter sp. J219]|jgi:copper resistance protein B|uniref:Copper resistance protein B n=1 Tax=Piscinibacter gummiphilus TaxID=946333 RepID=A0ABZ0D0Y8_9BURK|nr:MULTISPECIES: copper resistance protein B [Burkholderiales]MCR5882216.1 copper resistance protein B [Rhizobacter sp. J219]WOB10912.1 copper resistance protein B [Piscinibacter gummiphilus]
MNTKNIHPGRLLCLALASTLAGLAGPARAMEDDAIFQTTRIEVDAGRSDSKSIAAWRADGWIGTDYNRFAWRVEGTRSDGRLEDAEVQGLYSRYVAPFWDLQLGLRRELKPAARNYAVIGARGLAPYAFDVDVAAFVRSDGRLFARTRVEYDLLFTNRLIAKPFIGIDWAARSIPSDSIKAGATSSEWGVNLRYEITRAVAPYVEIGRHWQRGPDAGAGLNSVRGGLRLVL